MMPNVLVTGASRGIGASILETLSSSGAKCIGVSGKDFDLGIEKGPSLLWDHVLDQLDGRVDVLVNNAGVFEANPIEGNNEDWRSNWSRTMQINLTAAAELCRLAVLHWQQSKREGRIVNIASRAAHRGDSPEHWHYAASKGGMVSLTKTIARAYAASGICAFAICPGFTMTGMAEDYLASRGGDALLRDIPLGRVATPDEVAEIAAFCALKAPPSMTGAILDVNGASYVR